MGPAFNEIGLRGEVEGSGKPKKKVRGRVNTPFITDTALAAATGGKGDDDEEEEGSPEKKAGFGPQTVDYAEELEEVEPSPATHAIWRLSEAGNSVFQVHFRHS